MTVQKGLTVTCALGMVVAFWWMFSADRQGLTMLVLLFLGWSATKTCNDRSTLGEAVLNLGFTWIALEGTHWSISTYLPWGGEEFLWMRPSVVLLVILVATIPKSQRVDFLGEEEKRWNRAFITGTILAILVFLVGAVAFGFSGGTDPLVAVRTVLNGVTILGGFYVSFRARSDLQLIQIWDVIVLIAIMGAGAKALFQSL